MYIINNGLQLFVSYGLTTHVFELPKGELVHAKSTQPSKDADTSPIALKMTTGTVKEVSHLMEHLTKPFDTPVFMYKASGEAENSSEFIILTTITSFYDAQELMKNSAIRINSEPKEIKSLMEINHPGDIYYHIDNHIVPVCIDPLYPPVPFYTAE